MMKKKITKIEKPWTAPPPFRKVGIYCRVSTNSPEQLRSMSNQVSYLTHLVYNRAGWVLYDIYIDFQSGTNAQNRTEFQRMIYDCKNHALDIIITKSISRLGRNTAVFLEALQQLKNYGVEVIFDAEQITTASSDSTFLLSILESYHQAENENRSRDVCWGIKKRAQDGTSKFFLRRCYGYTLNKSGELTINDEEAKIVRLIFDLYLQGASLSGIQKELERKSILSPTGNEHWCNRTIDKILSNEKYIGDAILFKTITIGFPNRKRIKNTGQAERYYSVKQHPAIISQEIFDAVQAERVKRCNVIHDENGTHRCATKYSSKGKITEDN